MLFLMHVYGYTYRSKVLFSRITAPVPDLGGQGYELLKKRQKHWSGIHPTN